MSIFQLDIYGNTKLDTAIKRIKTFEPKGDGYYLAFSGGKDSIVVKELCNIAGVKYDAHYSKKWQRLHRNLRGNVGQKQVRSIKDLRDSREGSGVNGR